MLDNLTLQFEAALDLDGEKRDAFLNSLQDQALKKELLSLLKFTSPEVDILEKNVSLQVAWEVPEYQPGETLAHFIILKKIGQGSFGKVYQAQDTKLDRTVALKVTPLAGSEAQAMAHLSHNNIVQVYSETVYPEKNIRVICMQFIQGRTLSDVSPSELADYRKVLKIAEELSHALFSAHEKGILHLDIKPENILIDTEGKAYLTDFNISRVDSRDDGLLGGTSDYMSPEHRDALFSGKGRLSFKQLDERADIFSLGEVLRRLIAESDKSLVPQQVHRALNLIITKATQIEAERRTRDFKSFVQELEDLKTFDRTLKKLPAENFLDKIARNYPRATLFMVALIPQILGSIVNIYYNSIQIVSKLAPEQIRVFELLLFVLNPIAYGAAIFYIIRSFRPIFVFLVKGDATRQETVERAIKLCITGPNILAWVTTLGWGLNSVLFPFLIHVFAPAVEWDVYLHFAVSFFLSWLIAMTYSYLNTQYFFIRHIYPRVWNLSSLLKEHKEGDLHKIENRIKLFPFFSGAVPMLGALLIVLVGYEKNLLVIFIVLGILGLAHALVSTKRLLTVLYSFKE